MRFARGPAFGEAAGGGTLTVQAHGQDRQPPASRRALAVTVLAHRPRLAPPASLARRMSPSSWVRNRETRRSGRARPGARRHDCRTLTFLLLSLYHCDAPGAYRGPSPRARRVRAGGGPPGGRRAPAPGICPAPFEPMLGRPLGGKFRRGEWPGRSYGGFHAVWRGPAADRDLVWRRGRDRPPGALRQHPGRYFHRERHAGRCHRRRAPGLAAGKLPRRQPCERTSTVRQETIFPVVIVALSGSSAHRAGKEVLAP